MVRGTQTSIWKGGLRKNTAKVVKFFKVAGHRGAGICSKK